MNGSGHPNQLVGDEISSLAKIVMAVDEYDDLCNNPNRKENYTPYEALSLLYKNSSVNQTGDLDPNILVILIKALGVYPPGTVVELSDESLGVVISINSESRANPQVMLYVPEVAFDEAVIVDLAQESLTIQKSVRPKDLKKEVREFLSPHRVTGYFPSSTAGGSIGSSYQPILK